MPIDPCCGYMGLKTGAILTIVLPLLGFFGVAHDLFASGYRDETVPQLILEILFILFVAGVYALTFYGILKEKLALVKIGVIWKLVELAVIVLFPFLQYLYAGGEPYGNGHATIIAVVLDGYFGFVLLCLYKEMLRNRSYQSLSEYDQSSSQNARNSMDSNDPRNVRVRGVEVVTNEGRYRAFDITNVQIPHDDHE